MLFALYLIAAALILSYMTWGMFAIVMNLKRVKDSGRLTLAMKLFGYPYLVLGYVCDTLLNLTLGSLLFLELPQELVLTSRMTRHINSSSGWRCRLALWLTSELLDALDPSGLHR